MAKTTKFQEGRAGHVTRRAALLAGAGALAMPALATAQGRDINWRVVANIRDSRQTTVKWAWLVDQMAKATDGRMKISVTTFPELGLTGAEMVRMLSSSLLDAGEVVTGYVSGELPIVEGAQMVGVYRDMNDAKNAYQAWENTVIRANARRLGGVNIGSFAFASMFLWTKAPINTLADLKGKKIRIFAKAQADYLQVLGAESVSIPLAEVYPALERGVVDGVITGPDVANRTKLFEVAGHCTDLMLGPGAGYAMVSDRAWNGLPPDVKAKFEGLLPEFRKMSWDLGFEEDKEHLSALVAKGVKAVVPAKAEWVPELRRIAETTVVPAWVQRSGRAGAIAFNESIAPIVGFQAKV